MDSDCNIEASTANFVVIGHARCGSNLLGRALATHPQIRMAGEIFAKEEHTRKVSWERVNPLAWPKPRGEGYKAGEDAGAFAAQRIFSLTPFHDNILAFGFKIFYDHARSDEGIGSIWPYLIQNPIRIIHIHRRNLLASFVSNEVALKTNEWHLAVGSGIPAAAPVPPFSLHHVPLQRYFEEIATWRRWVDQTFAKHDVLTIYYEDDLCGNFSVAANKAFKFVGVMPWVTRPALQKQQALPLDEQVSNFAALKKHFRETPYAEFFATENSSGSDVDGNSSQRKGFVASLLGRKPGIMPPEKSNNGGES
jgi:LPS sulfotransferase NodH